MSREAMKQALEALEKVIEAFGPGLTLQQRAITALRQALETEKQEPVAWRTFDGEGGYDYRSYEMNETYDKEWSERNPNHKGWVEPLYTAPSKQWVGLTDEEIVEIAATPAAIPGSYVHSFGCAIEAKLREKNT